MKKPLLSKKHAIILITILLGVLFLWIFNNWRINYKNRFYPGITIGQLNLSGLTLTEAQEILNQETEKIISRGMAFRHGDKEVIIKIAEESFDPDLSYRLLYFDNKTTLEKIFQKTGAKNFGKYLVFQLTPNKNKNFSIAYELEEDRLKDLINQSFPELSIEPANAFFVFKNEATKLDINPEKIGKELNYQLALDDISNHLKFLNSSPINLKTVSKYPEIRLENLSTFESEAEKLINNQGFKLFYKKIDSNTTAKVWTVRPEKLAYWLIVEQFNDNWKLVFDKQKIAEYLQTNISPETDIEAQRPRFEIKNGKVSAWQKGISGQKLNIESSVEKIREAFLNEKKEIDLIIEEVIGEDLNDEIQYNIQEIIGTGHSNFAGSPTNRRKNIAVGAESVNGLLLAPGEEFSLVKALGEVSADSGYFPELVIKDNKTIPEYGGGLCQIATTIFRSALQSGLPITARRNHSYRVSYYEPAGTDAAVYIPNPDIRFLNDTKNYILIQTRIVKDDIYFDFWGKKDGREVFISDPVIYNIVKPAPTKFIETTELAPGEKKCTEKAHNGADAYFDYKVIYPEGSTSTPITERRFNSHYVPWREVCLIGVNPNSSSIINEQESSATTSTPTTSNIPTSSELVNPENSNN